MNKIHIPQHIMAEILHYFAIGISVEILAKTYGLKRREVGDILSGKIHCYIPHPRSKSGSD